jgi:hypothetical protein
MDSITPNHRPIQFGLRTAFVLTLLVANSTVVVRSLGHESFAVHCPFWMALVGASMRTDFRARIATAAILGAIGSVAGFLLVWMTTAGPVFFPAGAAIVVSTFGAGGAVVGLVLATLYDGVLHWTRKPTNRNP